MMFVIPKNNNAMKILKSFVLVAAVLAGTAVVAQTEPVLMTIDGNAITKDEFEYIYRKNNANNALDKKSLEEYVELFKNFKLKVIDAQHRGLDTLPTFISELRGYRAQLAKPYLTDMSMEEKLCREAYEHLQQDVEVSHVLIKLPDNATPADTLAAYNKALTACQRLANEDFATVALDMSDDPSVQRNKGYLGYFTGGMLVYPFEKAMYTLPVGEISAPVRTFYGYHIMKVHKRRPAYGQIRVSHIMKMVKADAPEAEQQKAHDEILKIAERLNNGEDFADVARETSDDRGSAMRGGELSWFGVGRMVREFENAAFALTEPGEVSQPVQSPFGWHIIKLHERRDLEPYEAKRTDILRQMQRDERASMGRKVLVDRLKREYGYAENAAAFDAVAAFVRQHAQADSAYFVAAEQLTDTLAQFADEFLLQKDLAMVIGFAARGGALSAVSFDEQKQDFVANGILNYEETQLETKYPEFRYLMQEYHDGILLFEISNTEVWEKAAKDTKGLEAYFAANKKNYAWDTPHYKGRIVYCKDAATAKVVKKMIAKLPFDSVNSYLNARVNNDSVVAVKTETGLWKKGDNAQVDKLAFGVKNAEVAVDDKFPVVFVVGKMLKKGPESYTDVRGAVISDYQNELERRWVDALRKQYEIVVDSAVLNTIE